MGAGERVPGRTENVALMQKRFELDNWYIKNWTLGLDIQILS